MTTETSPIFIESVVHSHFRWAKPTEDRVCPEASQESSEQGYFPGWFPVQQATILNSTSLHSNSLDSLTPETTLDLMKRDSATPDSTIQYSAFPMAS
jgi:hypothetical protein